MSSWPGRSSAEIHHRLDIIKDRIEKMRSYMTMRQEMLDWHGVMDASADIRELESEHRTLLWVIRHGERI